MDETLLASRIFLLVDFALSVNLVMETVVKDAQIHVWSFLLEHFVNSLSSRMP